MINFAVADRYAEARSGFERRDADIMKSVYLTLFLDKRKSGKFSIFVRNVANSRCLVDMYIPPTASARALVIWCFTHIQREASAGLLVQRRWAIPEPPFVERATVWLSRFFCCKVRTVSRWHNNKVCELLISPI